jgi:hypothetical protein
MAHALIPRASSQGLAQLVAFEKLRQTFLFIATAVFSAAVLWHFHDQFWWPPDEGAYVHVADRILAGDVLNRDVQDVHPGYVNFANALALWAFGPELRSLRYPLVAMALVQACLIFLLLLPRGAALATVGGIAMATLSTVQFLNPTAHWYCLFLVVLIIAALRWVPATFGLRLEMIGFLVMLLALFRQLTGVFLAMGALTWLLAAPHGEARAGTHRLGRSLIVLMAFGLSGYLWSKASLVAGALFGIWPFGLLWWAFRTTRLSDRAVLNLVGRLGAGGLAAALPLIGYHLWHSPLPIWIEDTVLAAISLTELDFFDKPSFALLPLLALARLLSLGSPSDLANGLFWLLLPLVPIVLGVLVLRSVARSKPSGQNLHPLPLLAVFYGLVSAHYEIPIYLFYTVGIGLAGILWLAADFDPPTRWATAAGAALLTFIGLFYHAGQPLSRGIAGTIAGTTVAVLDAPLGQRVGLRVEARDRALYEELAALVESTVASDETILALPFNPELYFITGRRNPVRFYNSALGIRTDAEHQVVLQQLRAQPPRLVFYRPDDKYNTTAAHALMEHVRRHYDFLGSRSGLEIYRSREDRPRGNDPTDARTRS